MLKALLLVSVAGCALAVVVITNDTERQQKVLSLLENIQQERTDADWWRIGSAYDVEANINKYTNKKAVEDFLQYYKSGFMPKDKTFSMSNDRMREEAIALSRLLYYAGDFNTFIRTGALARVRINDGQFLYAFYVAIYQRPDTNTLVLPSPYETSPQYFVDTKTLLEAYRVKMQNGTAFQNGTINRNG
ncbi:arylphorin subunit alpha-like [Cydia amplana]|uniref:arylphorin subunit alpha-like n=1 Tax=Cydia amplana TaxID=1869771 RepID=UPI002FE61BEF